MNIEKIKKARDILDNIIPKRYDSQEMVNIYDYLERVVSNASRALDSLDEALAELEKPAEDFLFNRYDPTTNEWDSPEMYESKTGEYVSYDDAIKYAESYHVKKCAECADRSAPRFPESRSGVTADVDK